VYWLLAAGCCQPSTANRQLSTVNWLLVGRWAVGKFKLTTKNLTLTQHPTLNTQNYFKKKGEAVKKTTSPNSGY